MTAFARPDPERLSAVFITCGAAAVAFAGLWAYFSTDRAKYVIAILAIYVFVWCLSDLRVAAVAFIAVGGVLPVTQLPGLKAGFITVKPAEMVLYLGLAIIFVRHRQTFWRGTFAKPVLLITAAATVAAAIGYARGAALTDVSQSYRAVLTILGYFVIRDAYAGRSRQLGNVLMGVTGLGAAVVLFGIVTHSRLLQSGTARDYVVTGTSTAAVDRVDSPVLRLVSVVLVLVLSTEMLRSKRLVRLLLMAVFVVVEAFSFTRSTWAPLLLVSVLAGALQSGRITSLARRVVVLAALAAIALGAAHAGALGSFGHTVYARAASIVNPKTVTESSFTARSNEDDLATAAISGSPFIGEGIGVSFGAYTNNSNSAAGTEVYVPQLFIHNTYLGIWVWLGFLGIVGFAYLAWRITAVSARLWRSHGPGAVSPLAVALGLLCLGVQSTFQTNLYYPPAAVALVAGLAYIDCWIGDHRTGEQSADAVSREVVDEFEQQDSVAHDLYPEGIVKIA